MTDVGNILMEKEILLESGTNELEVLVFRVGDFLLGVNVAKVREVLPSQTITSLPNAHSSVIGCFTLRDQVVPCVSLHRHLDENAGHHVDNATIILTEFNQFQMAFVVDSVERIHRISWKNVLPAPSVINGSGSPVTAITNLDGNLIQMLDFEMIADQVSEQAHRVGVVENPNQLQRETVRVLLADDSATVRQAVKETLTASGYTNLTIFENGEQAWNWIQQKHSETDSVSDVAHLLISDVEMPAMDGFRLTKNIKQHAELKAICVLLYSSILTDGNRSKGESVGANNMITKPQLSRIVDLADELLLGLESADQGESTSAKSGTPIAATASSQSTKNTATTASPLHPTDEPNSLWLTFRGELEDRIRRLEELCKLAADGQPDEQMINDTFRVLHSIKSAAMVVPIDEVSQTTHMMEEIFKTVQGGSHVWPETEISRYLGWLQDVANPSNGEKDVKSVLADFGQIKKEISAGSGN